MFRATKGGAESLGRFGEMFGMGKGSTGSSSESPTEKLAVLAKEFSRRERDGQGRLAFKLPLSLLENRINVEFKTQAKMGKNAQIEVIAYSTGSIYARLSAEWDKTSPIKPPAKHFTLKITPCYTELYNVSKKTPPLRESTEFADAELPQYEDEMKKMAWEAMPPAKHFTLKITPCYTELYNVSKKTPPLRESTEFADAELPQYEDEMKKMAWEAMCHNIECEFIAFSKIPRTYSLKVPIGYSARFLEADLTDPGVIIFEDFDKTAPFPITANLSLEALKSIVIALADIHAACLDNPPDWSQWAYPDYGHLNASQFMPAVAAIKNSDPMLFGQLFDRIHDVIKTCLNEHYGDDKKEKMHPPVLAHGFLNPSNLRWKKNEQDEITEEFAYIINWQGVHPGSFCEDLAYLLSTSASPETRRNDVDTLIELYVTQLEQNIAQVPFTVEQLKTSLKHHFRFEALRALLPLADYLVESSKNGTADNMNLLMRAKCLVEDLLLPEYDN
ncbi:putative oxidoreductase dhs-27 [Toxocara canis]|uniref:Putative oxidoreductase dhs-27 n=1 Tax=Toxocara canis TaxID=6265 RepID=A0A0B2W5K5_TOXCA|nr:putative oxidoreductase dhs-27 [Toxocara canis]